MHAVNGNPGAGAGKRTRRAHGAAEPAVQGNPTPESQPVVEEPVLKRAKEADAQESLQNRIGSKVVKVPGDGWCFFYAIGQHWRGSTGWNRKTATELYLQAMEWLLQAQYGPQSEAVAAACVPFNLREEQVHQRFLGQQPVGVDTAQLSTTELVLWSKLHALLQQPRMLDSIHHASAGVEMWALTQAFAFECLIWGKELNVNYWVRTMEGITDEEAHQKLQAHVYVLELVHQDIGVTGLYDLVERSQGVGQRFPVTPLLQTFRAQGPAAVLREVKRRREAAMPPLPAPGRPPSPSGDCPGDPEESGDASMRGCSAADPPRKEDAENAVHSEEDPLPPQWPQPDAEQQESESDVAATELDVDSVQSWDSESSVSSNDLDRGLTVEPHRTWNTVEDDRMSAVKTVAAAMRQHVLVPPAIPGHDTAAGTQEDALVFPAVHCAMQGCDWCSEQEPCNPNWSKKTQRRVSGKLWEEPCHSCCADATKCLWAHLTIAHADQFLGGTPAELPATYRASLLERERECVPSVGWSTDRRTFRRFANNCKEDCLEALICACCTRIHVAANGGEIGYISVEKLFDSLSNDSFTANWCYETYSVRYANIPAIQTRLDPSEWVRKLPDGKRILCCPEDMRCELCPPNAATLCWKCQLPLCRSCLTRMTQQAHASIPQALTNDNWLGYPCELLYQYKVRWIEAAAACRCGPRLCAFTSKMTADI